MVAWWLGVKAKMPQPPLFKVLDYLFITEVIPLAIKIGYGKSWCEARSAGYYFVGNLFQTLKCHG